jgi:hypothetical protein
MISPLQNINFIQSLKMDSLVLALGLALTLMSPEVKGFGLNFEGLSKTMKLAQGFTTGLLDNSMKMSPIRPAECWSDVENQGFIQFDDDTFGGP